MIRIGLTPEDYTLAAEIAQERGSPVPFGERGPREGALLLVDPDRRAMVFLHREPLDGHWYFQHVWAPVTLWPRFAYQAGTWLTDHGFGDAQVRWSSGSTVTEAARALVSGLWQTDGRNDRVTVRDALRLLLRKFPGIDRSL